MFMKWKWMDAKMENSGRKVSGRKRKRNIQPLNSNLLSNEIEPPQVEIKSLILTLKEPVVFKNRVSWPLLNWSLDDWSKLFGDKQLDFRCGDNLYTKDPQWERTTPLIKSTFENFLQEHQDDTNKWMYFDYKHLQEWFTDIKEFKQNIDWSAFGFDDLGAEDSTIWIGSNRAHTPCHYDSYGCNLVAQVYGRKMWFLFPPDNDSEKIKPTRVPYEESSIYSQHNFFSPDDIKCLAKLKHCRKVILEPGDVLLVPNHWWHYVENVGTAISINTWLPLSQDNSARLQESLVKFFVGELTQNLPPETRSQFLNPNSDNNEPGDKTIWQHVHLISACANRVCHDKDDKKQSTKDDQEKRRKQLSDLKGVAVPVLSKDELQQFLEAQRCRFHGEISSAETAESDKNSDVIQLVRLVNSITSADVLQLIGSKLTR